MRRLPRSRTIALAVAAALALGGCRAAVLAYGPDFAAAKTNADAFAASIEARFTNVARSAKFSAARMRIARYAFAPSKVAQR